MNEMAVVFCFWSTFSFGNEKKIVIFVGRLNQYAMIVPCF